MEDTRDVISKQFTASMLAGPSGFHVESRGQQHRKSEQWINEAENREEKASSFDNPPSQELDISVTKHRIKRFPSRRRRLSEVTNSTNDSRLSKAHFAIPPATSLSESAVPDQESQETGTSSFCSPDSWFTTSVSPPRLTSNSGSFHSCHSEIDVSEEARVTHAQPRDTSETSYNVKSMRNKFENL